MKPATLGLALTLLAASPSGRGEDAYPRIDSDTAMVRTLPAATALMGEIPASTDYFNAGIAEFRPLLNYLDDNDLPKNSPVEGRPDCARAFVFYLDAAHASKALPSAPGIRKVALPERTVAALAARGGYGEDKLKAMRKRLADWVASRPELKPTGPAYFVYWHPVYVPSFYRKVEVHIPVTVTTPAPASAKPEQPGKKLERP